MNNSEGGNLQKAGAGAFGGHIQAASANFTVGAVGFGPHWSAEDSMAESIVRIQRELEEAQAQIAVYEAERSILKNERDNWRAAAAQATADRDRNKREWDKCAAELAAALNSGDEDDYVQLTAKGLALLEGRR